MYPLSRQRERAGVRVDIVIIFPLTVALRYPVFFELSIVERDFILSPLGRGDTAEYFPTISYQRQPPPPIP
jgi:hypothetical protein